MYLDEFGFRKAPFGVTPDPGFMYLGRTHEQALSSLRYGIEQRQGFVMVTGEVGTGKTLLCRALLDRLGDKTSTALILNPCLPPLELLRMIVADLGIAAATGEKTVLLEALNRFLLAKLRQGEHVVLILDEAQTLPNESLEEIRLLSNLETDREKLLQIVLVGQPELLVKLNLPQLRQVNQRITVRCNLLPLPPQEIRQYVAHRLLVASGRARPDLFTPAGLRAISHLSRGYPREINALCDRALLAAYAAGGTRVGVRFVYRAYRDLRRRPARFPGRLTTLLRWAVPTLLLATAGGLALREYQRSRPSAPFTNAAPAAPLAAPAPVESPRAEAVSTSPPPDIAKPTTEVPSAGGSLSASLTTLSLKWKMERLARDVGRWQFVSLQDRSLPAFFQQSGLARTHGMEILALPATLDSLRATDLPCLASEKSGDGYRFVVLSGLQQDVAVILDPVAGRRALPFATWLANVRGLFYFLVPSRTNAPALRPGDRGANVLGLQKELRRARFLRGNPGGVYGRETTDAVLALQKKHGIDADGVAGLETRLQLLRLVGTTVPTLLENP